MDEGTGALDLSSLVGVSNASNAINSEAADCESKAFVVPIFFTLIATVGIIANSVVIFIITVLKEYEKSVTNIYVLQLAIADFIFLFQVFFQARTMLLGQWTYGVAWCKISEAIKMLNYYSSISFLTVMSVDRYMAINLAMNQKVRKYRTKLAACVVSLCTWCIAFLSIINILIYGDVHECDCQIYFPVGERTGAEDYDSYFGIDTNETEASGVDGPPIPFYSVDGQQMSIDDLMATIETNKTLIDDLGLQNMACSLRSELISQYFKTWLVCNFLLAFVVPLIIICVAYALIVRRIMKPMAVGSKSQKSNETRKRVTRMVTGLVSTFIICWLPYHSFNLLRLNGLNISGEACDNAQYFTIVLAYSNSAINPFFYTFLATNFRKRWGNAVGKTRRGLRRSILSHSGDYTPGTSFKGRRKSSLSNSNARNRDDVSVSSFVTKNTIVPLNNEIKEDKL